MDHATLAKDVGFHFGIPAAARMTEVHTRSDEVTGQFFIHKYLPPKFEISFLLLSNVKISAHTRLLRHNNRLWLNPVYRTKPVGYLPTPADKSFAEYSIPVLMSRFKKRFPKDITSYPCLFLYVSNNPTTLSILHFMAGAVDSVMQHKNRNV
jgi:hypothetical protein